MNTKDVKTMRTRVIALGSAALMDGFATIGIETIRDASPGSLDNLLARLSADDQRAVVFIESDLARSASPWLQRLRARGGRVIIVEIPALNAPDDYQPVIETMVRGMPEVHKGPYPR